MISALITRDLYLAARDRAFRITLSCYLFIFLAGSLIFFSNFLAAANYPFAVMSSMLFFRISAFQGVMIAVLTPWLILRMQEQEIPGLSDAAGSGMLAPPWKIILGRLIASAVFFSSLVILSLPVLYLARLMGAATFRQIAWVLADTFAFLLLLTVLIFHVKLRFKSWFSSWILSYAVLGLTGGVWYKIWSFSGPEFCSMTFLLLLVFSVALLFPHANRALLYERN